MVDGTEELFAEKLIRPYCSGVGRYAKSGKSMKLMDYDFLVHEVIPDESWITNKTLIRVKLFKNNSNNDKYIKGYKFYYNYYYYYQLAEYQTHKFNVPPFQLSSQETEENNEDDDDPEGTVENEIINEQEIARRPPESFIAHVSLEKFKNRAERPESRIVRTSNSQSNPRAARRQHELEEEEEKKSHAGAHRRSDQRVETINHTSNINTKIHKNSNVETNGRSKDTRQTTNQNTVNNANDNHEKAVNQVSKAKPGLVSTGTLTHVTNRIDFSNGPILGTSGNRNRSPGASMKELNRLAEANPRGVRENRIVDSITNINIHVHQVEQTEPPAFNSSLNPVINSSFNPSPRNAEQSQTYYTFSIFISN